MPVHAVALSVGPDAGVEATINDVPFTTKHHRDPYASDMPVEHDVVPGANKVVIVVTRAGAPAGGPPRPAKTGDGLFVAVKVHVNEGAMHGDQLVATSQVLVDQRWPPEGATGEVTLPHRIEIGFSAPAARAPIWLAAPVLPAGAVDADALAAIDRLAAQLRNGDFDGFGEAMKFKYEDMARVYPIYGSASRMRAADIQSLRDLMAEPGARVVDPRTLAPVFRLRAGGRMVEALGADGEPLLRVTHRKAAEPDYLKASFARIDGTLMPVR